MVCYVTSPYDRQGWVIVDGSPFTKYDRDLFVDKGGAVVMEVDLRPGKQIVFTNKLRNCQLKTREWLYDVSLQLPDFNDHKGQNQILYHLVL